MTALVKSPSGELRCGNPQCSLELVQCCNHTQHGVCNGSIATRRIDPKNVRPLCNYCFLTVVVPDLKVNGNLEKWRRLESDKARVLYIVEQIGLPILRKSPSLGDSGPDKSATPTLAGGNESPNDRPRLSFRFMADGEKPINTGYARGCITINLREADSIERERTRVEFGELQRTLVGHFRHELGHYYWELLVKPHCLNEFRGLFGDESKLDYAASQKAYYAQGPMNNWRNDYISGYATMHPWEDFAETFGVYLDLVTVLDTAEHFGFAHCGLSDLPKMLLEYKRIGVVANEYNRDMGLLDLVPEVFTPTIQHKLQFIHDLRNINLG